MTESAQALEAAIEKARQGLIGFAAEIQDGRVPVVGAVRDHLVLNLGLIASFLADALLAVPPPPPVGSPTTEDVQTMREHLGVLFNAMWRGEYSQQGQRFAADHQVGPVLKWLDTMWPPPRVTKSTPVAPAGASEPTRLHYVDTPPHHRVVGVFSDGSYMIEHGDGQREHVYVRRSAKGYQAPVSPVAPEPPTESDRGIPLAIRQEAQRCAADNGRIAYDYIVGLYRRGAEARTVVDRNGDVLTQAAIYRLLDLADAAAPTGEPAPCVWRDIESAPKDGTGVLVYWQYWSEQPFVAYFKHGRWNGEVALSEGDTDGPTAWTPLPAPPVSGHPLTVER